MKRVLSVCLLLLLSAPLSGAEVPKLTGPVNDEAGVLSDKQKKELTEFLLKQEKDTTNQIVILTVKSLDGDTIEDFAVKVFAKWKLGQKGKDNGVLIILATTERKMRIEVGHGLEGVLTDAISSRIIREEMTSKFKEKNFDGGFMAAVVAIDKAIKGEYTAEESGGWPTWLTIVIIIVVIILILILIDCSMNGGDAFTWIILGSIMSGDGGGGGGGYSGGGGGSGGGGASGCY